MRAVLIKGGSGGIESLFIGSTPKPTPSVGEVLVKVRCILPCSIRVKSLIAYYPGKVKAFGLNRADIMQREGRYPPPAGASKILGLEFSGTIAEVGKEVTQWKINDEVLGLVGGVHKLSASCRVMLNLTILCSWSRVPMQNLSSRLRHTFGKSRHIYHG